MQKKIIAVFAGKAAAVLLAVCALIGVLNQLYVHGYYYSDVYSEVQKMTRVPEQITMANFGTSHGLASFHYPKSAGVCFNFALSGGDIYHDFATLRQFSDHLAAGCIVAIPTSYFSFCMSTQEPSQKRYYLYLDRKYLRGFQTETLLNAKYLPVLRSGEYIIKDLIKDQEMDVGAAMMTQDTPKDPPQAETAAAAAAPQPADAARAALGAHANGRAESWRSGYMIAGRDFIPENTQLLTEMVQYCYAQGFRPVLVSTPIYQALNARFDEEELRICYFDPMAAVQEATGVPYLDASHDPELSTNPGYFSNSDHQNASGAAAFWEKYQAFLQEIGYLN